MGISQCQVSSEIKQYKELKTIEENNIFYNIKPITNEDKLIHKIFKSCNTFGNIGLSNKLYSNSNHLKNKINSIDKYKFV